MISNSAPPILPPDRLLHSLSCKNGRLFLLHVNDEEDGLLCTIRMRHMTDTKNQTIQRKKPGASSCESGSFTRERIKTTGEGLIMLLTIFLALVFCFATNLVMISAVAFIQNEKFFSSAPKEAQELIKPEKKSFLTEPERWDGFSFCSAF